MRMSIAWKNSSDLGGQRRAARDREPQPAAEARLDLRVDEPVGEPVLCGEPAGSAGPAWRSTLTRRPTSSAQSISFRFAPVSSSNLATTAVWTFSYTRGTLGKTVGFTAGSASAAWSGSGRKAIL